MKNTITYAVLAVLTTGCIHDSAFPTQPIISNGINLGAISYSAVIAQISSNIISGKLTIHLIVTRGAKYSLQLTDITNNIIKTHGFTADREDVLMELDYSTVPDGAYDLNLIDTAGNATKVPIIIKH
jgi:hypothetical protein